MPHGISCSGSMGHHSICHFFFGAHGMLGWGMDEQKDGLSVAGGLRRKRQDPSQASKFVALFLAGSSRQAFTERMMASCRSLYVLYSIVRTVGFKKRYLCLTILNCMEA